jgi:hypothetical protein
MAQQKSYTYNHILNEYNSFTCKKQNEILYSALDYMQSYNGRSRFLCIAMAMGYENFEGGTDTYTKRNQ